MVHERTSTPEGIEANFATNSLGTWALTVGIGLGFRI
jgi:dehydrogenase/reductase SDR family protein 12